MTQATFVRSQAVPLPSRLSLMDQLRAGAASVADLARNAANSNTLRNVCDHKLTKTFMNVAQKAGVKAAFKFAAAGVAGAAGANVVGVALAGGLGVTIGEAILEYRAHLRAKAEAEQAEREKGVWGFLKGAVQTVKGFFGFVNQNRRDYGLKLLKNSGLGLLGAGVGAGLKEVWDAGGRDVFESVSSRFSADWSSFKGFFGFGAVPAPVDVPVVDTAPSVNAEMIVDTPNGSFAIFDGHVEQLTPSGDVPEAPIEPAAAEPEAPEFSLENINTEGWSDAARADLEAAEKGAPWALQNLAHYSANGLNGVVVDLDAARELAEQAKAAGSSLSEKFLADLDGRTLDVPAPDVALASVAEVMDAPLDHSRALNDLEDIAHADGNQALKDTIVAARRGSAQAWKDLAHEAMQAGDPVSAYALNAEALEVNPNHGQAQRFAEDLMKIPSAREAIEAAKDAAIAAVEQAVPDPVTTSVIPESAPVQGSVSPTAAAFNNQCTFDLSREPGLVDGRVVCLDLTGVVESGGVVHVTMPDGTIEHFNFAAPTAPEDVLRRINASIESFLLSAQEAEAQAVASRGGFAAEPAAPGISN
jgi:hypothetical protein